MIMAIATNDIKVSAHFWLREFETRDGFVTLHSSTLHSLEKVRADLAIEMGMECGVYINEGIRTPEENRLMGARFGYTDDSPPGKVSRYSMHLPAWARLRPGQDVDDVPPSGIAVDIVARVMATGAPVPQSVLGRVCERYFDWVKSDYADGHVHADNRAWRASKGD